MIHLIERFTDTLKKGRYNSQTIVAYRNAIYMFYNEFREIPQNKIDEDLIANYLKGLTEKKGGTQEATIQTGKAIKLFYETIFSKKLNIKASGESKEGSIPVVFTKEEVVLFLKYAKKIKPKAIFSLVYSCGLTLSELLNLKIEHLNFETGKLLIVDLKDKSNTREVNLPKSIKPFIDEYIEDYMPKVFLFENDNGKQITARSVQISFQKILEKSGIQKDATVHSLRHSYAVHLMQKGIDIHIIQQLMGHKYLQTTTIYNQFVNVKLVDIESPLLSL